MGSNMIYTTDDTAKMGISHIILCYDHKAVRERETLNLNTQVTRLQFYQ